MNKRFIIFDGTLMQGGAERVISILSRRMREEELDVRILLLRDRPIFYEIDPRIQITVVEKETGSSNLLRNLGWMRAFFRKNADIIISFLAPFNMLALIAHAGLKSQIIVADRNDPRHIPTNALIRGARDFLYRFADGIVVQTKHNQAYFAKSIRNKSRVIYNPVDMGEYRGMALRMQKQKKIVSVGRLTQQKNQKMLISAFAEATKEKPDYQLVIYGDGPMRAELESMIADQGLQDRVMLPGSVKNVFECIADSELFILSSDYEGMPNALIEAMCLGLACISTKVSGATDLIQDGVNGALVGVNQKGELEKKIALMLENDEMRRSYAQNAAQLNEELEVGKIMSEWIDYAKAVSLEGDKKQA